MCVLKVAVRSVAPLSAVRPDDVLDRALARGPGGPGPRLPGSEAEEEAQTIYQKYPFQFR